MEDGGDRRIGLEGHVDMPLIGLGALIRVQDDDLGMALDLGQERMHLQLPQSPSQGDMRLWGEVFLVREEDHEVLEQQLVDALEEFIGELGQIDTADLRAECSGDGGHHQFGSGHAVHRPHMGCGRPAGAVGTRWARGSGRRPSCCSRSSGVSGRGPRPDMLWVTVCSSRGLAPV
ncbi:hypothetical protein SANTM175S_02180 [Streptomyces antimycoticus]